MSNANLGTASFQITGSAAGATNAANQANNALAQLSEQVNYNWWGLQNLGHAFAALPAAVAVGVGAAIKHAADWEDAMLGVERTTDLEGQALARLEDQLQRIASTRPIAAVEVAGVAEAAGALGILESDIADFTQTIVDFSALTGMTTDAAATGLARIAALTGVAGSGFSNLASAVFRVGVNTAATEEEIISIGTRLAGAASAVGLTADELVGLSAAIRSAGIRAEMGATAIQKTFLDMNASISENSDNLRRWAVLAGETPEAFAEAFRGGDAMQMFVQVISNMGDMTAAGQDVVGMLQELGITEARQTQALLVLSKAQNQTANTNAQLTSALEYAREGLFDTTEYLDKAQDRANTFNGQVQILKNNLFALGASFGQSGGIAKDFIEFLADLIRGIQFIPGPMKIVIGVVGALITGISALGAVIVMLGSRLFLAGQGFAGLSNIIRGNQGAQAQARGGIAQTNAALVQQQGAVAQTTTQWVQNRNAQGQFIAGGRYVTTTIQQQNSTLQTQAGLLPTLRVMWQNHAVALRRAAIASASLIASTIALMIVTARAGNAAEKAANDRLRATETAKRDIMLALEEEAKGHKGAAQAALESLPAYGRLADATDKVGVSMQTTKQIIQDNVALKDFDEWMRIVTEAEENGSSAATQLRRDVSDLRDSYVGAHQTLGVASDGIEEFTSGVEGNTEAIEDNSEALQKLHDHLSAVAQAHIDYISAQFAAREAAFSLREAEQELADARADLADPTRRLRDLEDALAKARLDQQRASDNVSKAEVELGRSRQKGLDDLADAQDDLVDANDRYLDSIEKVQDLEEALADLRAGPSLDEITEATNKLRDAQLDLIAAHRKVSDAEWYLQHLREEGASDRDIADAEFALASARQDTANAAQDVRDAEQELSDLTDPVKRAEAIADAERDLVRARREVAENLREIRDAEQDLADIRARVASDAYYREALAELTAARLSERDAIRAVQEAERELQRMQGEGAALEAERAQLRYEQALYRVAEANMEVRRQQAAMRGEFWDSGDAAHALAEELGLMMGSVSDPAAQKRLREFMDTLRSAPDVPDAPDRSGADVGDPFAGIGGISGEDLLGGLSDEISQALQDGILDGMGSETDWTTWLLPIGAMIVGGIASAVAGAVIAGGAMAIAAAAVIAALIAAIVALFMNDEFRGDFLRGLEVIWNWLKEWVWGLPEKALGWGQAFWDIASDWIQGLWDGVREKVGEFFGNIGDWLYDQIVAPIKRIFGINSPSTVFANIGRDLIRGLWSGLREIWSSVSTWFSSLPGKIKNVFLGAGRWLWNVGKDLIRGLKNGITEGLGSAIDAVKSGAKSIVDTGKRWLGISSPSKIFTYYGEMIAQGLADGMAGSGAAIQAAIGMIGDVRGTVEKNLQNQLSGFGIDYLTGEGGVMQMRLDATQLRNMALDRPTINNYETLNLDAITTADPTEIVNEYVWQKRVRVRGA